MRNKLIAFAALVAAAAVGVGIGVAQGAASQPNSNSRPVRVALRPSAAPFKGSAQTMFAVVDPSGTLARSYGVVSSSEIGTSSGAYKILFKRGVAKCAYVATLGWSGSFGNPPIGYAGVVGLNGHKAGVFVKTYDQTGTATPAGFHLVVTCPPLA